MDRDRERAEEKENIVMEIEERNLQEKYYYNVVYVFTADMAKCIGTSIISLDTSFFDREEATKKIKEAYQNRGSTWFCILSWHKSSKEEFDHFDSSEKGKEIKEIKVSDISLIYL